MTDDNRNEFWLDDEAHVIGNPDMSDDEKDVLLKMARAARAKNQQTNDEHECTFVFAGKGLLEIEEFDDVGDVISIRIEETDVYECTVCGATHDEW